MGHSLEMQKGVENGHLFLPPMGLFFTTFFFASEAATLHFKRVCMQDAECKLSASNTHKEVWKCGAGF